MLTIRFSHGKRSGVEQADPNQLQQRMEHYYKQRTVAYVYLSEVLVGGVSKLNGVWQWWYEPNVSSWDSSLKEEETMRSPKLPSKIPPNLLEVNLKFVPELYGA